jgi:hypothetical protein
MMIMKNFKFLYLLLAVVGVVTFTSCTEDWAPGAQDTNAGVYFADTSVINVTAETTSVDIVVMRTNAADALTVTIRSEVAENSVDILTVPSSVSFAAGSDTAVLTVDVNGAAMAEGKRYKALLKLDGEQASTYGASEFTFTFMIPEKWVDYVDEAGKLVYGTYIDDFFCPVIDYPAGYAVAVQIQKHESDVNRYRVIEPFGKLFFDQMFGGVPGYFQLTPGSVIEFNVADPNNVTVVGNPVNLGAAINFSDIGLAPMYLYIESDENGQIPGAVTFKDGVFSFGANQVYVVYENEGQLNILTPTNASGLMAFVLPGVEVTDYSLEAEYTGMKVESDNKSTSAILNFYYGTDVESFKFTLVDGNITDATAIVEAIVAGSEEYTIYDGSIDTMEYVVPAEGAGMKTVVAVPYAGGEAQASDALAYAFYFPGLGNAELPEVEISIAVDSVVGITGNAEYEANYPSDSTMCIYMEANGDEIKSIMAYVGTGVPAEVTPEEALSSPYAEDFSGFIPEMIENGYALAVYTGLTPGTTYDVFLGFTTIYGETKYFRTAYTPAAAAAPEA